MGRRRRKQARSERETGRGRPDQQGELLSIEAVDPLLNDEESVEPEEPIEVVMNGRPRELVLFEMLDEVAAAARDPQPAEADHEAASPPADPVEPEAVAQREAWRTTFEPEFVERAEEPDEPERAEAPRVVEARARIDEEEVATPNVSFDEPHNLGLALERLEAARVLSPDSLGVLVNLGWTLGLMGRFDDAERELRRAQRLAPDDIAVRAGLGLLAYRRGLYQQADIELRWVCEQNPEHGPAHFYRGEALNRLGRVDQALEMLQRAARLQPTNYRAFYTMGILFDRKNLREEAAAMYRKARELQHR